MNKLIEGLGSKLSERFAAALLAPAALFWGAGAAAWIVSADGWNDSGKRITAWLADLTGVEQILAAAGVMGLFIASQAVVEQLTLPVLRGLEGYWRPYVLRNLGTKLKARWNIAHETTLQTLEQKRSEHPLSATEEMRRLAANRVVLRYPSPEHRMPTKLGNIIRSGEQAARSKYGLDSIVCWPRLWLILDDEARATLTAARRDLDTSAVLWTWGALVLVWTPLTWLAIPAAVATCLFAYWWAVQRATVFADLIESTFDVHRWALYDALRIKAPSTSDEEPTSGAVVTEYLLRGTSKDPIEFVHETRRATPCQVTDSPDAS